MNKHTRSWIDAAINTLRSERERGWGTAISCLQNIEEPVHAEGDVYVVNMDTEHFQFCAVGRTEVEALAGIVQTMRRHRAQYGEETWHPGHYHYMTGDVPEDYPEDDSEWLTRLAVDYYGAGAIGPFKFGNPGTRDGDFIRLRGEG